MHSVSNTQINNQNKAEEYQMTVKPWKNRHDLATTLIDERHLQSTNVEEIESTLKKLNYFQLINGLENDLLYQAKPKRFHTETLDDFKRLYKFNKQLESAIFILIEDFEDQLKTSLAHNFSANHCRTLNDTMQYTNKHNYQDIQNDKQYPFKRYQYNSTFNRFMKFELFKPHFIDNLIKNNDFIDPKFYQDIHYVQPEGVTSYYKDKHVAVPLWVTIQTLDFGTLIKMTHYLKTNDMNGILNDFNFRSSSKFAFLSALDVIKELRNKCAHGFLIERFSTPEYIKLNRNLVSNLSLNPYHKGGNNNFPSRLTLFDSLKVLGMFVGLKPLRKIFKKMIYENNKNFSKSSYDLNSRILRDIGAPSYKDLKEICVDSGSNRW